MRLNSWGRYPYAPQKAITPGIPAQALQVKGPFLPRGLGRSYGDSCLTPGQLLDLTHWNRFMNWNEANGILQVEAGVSLQKIIEVMGPRGWLPAVLPGTSQVTVGGAIANDIHGKNHHREGTFGCHVVRLEVIKSDGTRTECSPADQPELFAATIGGLGLTGIITWAELQLRPIPGPLMTTETIKFRNLAEFFTLNEQSDRDFEYTVAWLDTASGGRNLGRGHFIRANHSQQNHPWQPIGPTVKVPFEFPNFALNRFSLSLFNTLYYQRQRSRTKRTAMAINPFFFPLDRVGNWNLVYGPRGFLQYQCVTPNPSTIEKILVSAKVNHKISFLSVLKKFGTRSSPGWLSFPKPGFTLAMDFPISPDLFPLLDQWDEWVLEDGGRIYPAKDARMAPLTFRSQFPMLKDFVRWVDPQIRSLLWQRLMEES